MPKSKAPKPLIIRGFEGMNNVLSDNGFQGLEDGSMIAIPKIILNANVTAEKRLKEREGYSLFFGLPNSHSAWGARGVLLVASEGRLYRFYKNGTKINLCALSGPPEEKLYYSLVDNNVYISSRHWTGILNSADNTVDSWGMSIPEQPVLAISNVPGSLSPGRYQVCYTRIVDGQIGGSGMISAIEVLADNSAISLLNKPSEVVSWVTDPNGSTFYRTEYEKSEITAVETIEPLPTFLCGPPDPMRFIRKAFGRMWGTIDNRLIYSEPYRYDLFKSTNSFPFPTEILMAAFVDGGIYVGFEDRTVFLPGTEPSAFREVSVGEGVSRNIFAYCNNVPEVGNNIPVWVSKNDLIAGNHSGSIVSLLKGRVQFPAGEEGAAVFRTINGQDQLLTSYKQIRPHGSGIGFGDSATCEVVRNGTVI